MCSLAGAIVPSLFMVIGVISDTHGLLRPEAVSALQGSDRIIHAGDVGAPEVLTALAAVAPVTAVRGNNDHGTWAKAIATTEVVDADGVLIYVIHDVKELDLDPAAGGFRVVVSGHSHRPSQETRDGVLWFNPGSAGPRRFQLPVAVGIYLAQNAATNCRAGSNSAALRSFTSTAASHFGPCLPPMVLSKLSSSPVGTM